MTTEMTYLIWVTALTAVLWIPYVTNLIAVRGIIDAIGYPENPKPIAPWAQRLRAAHYNAVENLVIFAVLVFTAHFAGISNEATAIAAITYFWARLVHAIGYTFAIPGIRTLSFLVGFGCQITFLVVLLG